MGNICSKSSNQPDNFSQPGRVLGSAAPASGTQPTSAPVPSKITSSPGRTLGQGGDAAGDPRSAAARAAEERASKANRTSGKLSTQLAAQKKQTRDQVLNSVSQDERSARTQDSNAEVRNWN